MDETRQPIGPNEDPLSSTENNHHGSNTESGGESGSNEETKKEEKDIPSSPSRGNHQSEDSFINENENAPPSPFAARLRTLAEEEQEEKPRKTVNFEDAKNEEEENTGRTSHYEHRESKEPRFRHNHQNSKQRGRESSSEQEEDAIDHSRNSLDRHHPLYSHKRHRASVRKTLWIWKNKIFKKYFKNFFHLTYYQLHMAYFIFLTFVGSGVLYAVQNGACKDLITHYSFVEANVTCPPASLALETPLERRLDYIDALFMMGSGATVTGLTTVDVSQLCFGSQVVLIIWVIIGSQVLMTLPLVILRRHYYRVFVKRLLKRQQIEEAAKIYRETKKGETIWTMPKKLTPRQILRGNIR
jgi:hypothetical protein